MLRRILKRIDEGDPLRRDENVTRLLVLSLLRDASDAVETEMATMNMQVDLSKIETFREFGRQGQARIVADQIVAKFGIPAGEAEETVARVAAASEADIKILSIRVLTANNLGELFEGIPEPDRPAAPSH